LQLRSWALPFSASQISPTQRMGVAAVSTVADFTAGDFIVADLAVSTAVISPVVGRITGIRGGAIIRMTAIMITTSLIRVRPGTIAPTRPVITPM
jgi:hypothetical protein